MKLELTESAKTHVNKMLQSRGKGLGIRLGVRKTGCSGLAYKLEYADVASPDDHVFDFPNFVVLVGSKDAPYFEGVVVDYVKEGLSEGFKFDNPNVKAECGCGESFKV